MLDPQESLEEIKCREVELGSESWTSFVSVIPQQRSNGYCPCVCSAHQLKQQLRSTLVAAHWRGPRHCLNIVVVLAVVHGLLGLSGSERAVEPLTLPLLPHPFSRSPSLISHIASVDIKHHDYTLRADGVSTLIRKSSH